MEETTQIVESSEIDIVEEVDVAASASSENTDSVEEPEQEESVQETVEESTQEESESESISVENENDTENDTSSDADPNQESESISFYSETDTEYVSGYSDEQHAEIIAHMEVLHEDLTQIYTGVRYLNCLLIVFFLVIICVYTYRFFNMFLTGNRRSF